MLRDSFQNIEFLRRIQKIRHYYRGLVPEAEQFFDPPGRDGETASEMATVGLNRGAAALLFTGASTIAAINSILGGAGLALLLAYTIGLDKASVTAVGVLAAVLLFGLHLAYEYSPRRPCPPTAARTSLLATADRPQRPHTRPPIVTRGHGDFTYRESSSGQHAHAYSHGAHNDELRKALDRGHAHRIDRARIGPLHRTVPARHRAARRRPRPKLGIHISVAAVWPTRLSPVSRTAAPRKSAAHHNTNTGVTGENC